MNDCKIRNLSIIASLGSLIAIYLLAYFIPPKIVLIDELGYDDIGETVSVKGFVKNINSFDGNYFIILEDRTGEMKIVLWEKTVSGMIHTNLDVNKLKEDTEILVKGKVHVYNGYLEIIPTVSGISIVK